MVEQVVTLLEMISAIGLVMLLVALAAFALLTLVSSVGAVLEHGGDRLDLLQRYVARGTDVVAGWVRSGAGVLDLLAAALTGQSPAHYVERRRQAGAIGRQTGLSAAQTQTDSPSARHNVPPTSTPTPLPRTDAPTPAPPTRSVPSAAPQSARNVQSDASHAARTMRSDAAQHALADVQVARILRHYRTADALVEALLLAGWGVGQVRAVVRLDNNRVSEIAARVRGIQEEARDGMG